MTRLIFNLRRCNDEDYTCLNRTPDCENLKDESEMLESGDIKLYPNPASSNITIAI